MTEHHARPYRIPLILAALSVVMLLWAYATTLGDIAWRWASDPQYSHGYLVPAFAAGLLWLRRNRLDTLNLKPSAVGLVLLLPATALRLYGTRFYFPWLDQISLLFCVAGIVLLAGGKAAWRWAWPAVAF